MSKRSGNASLHPACYWAVLVALLAWNVCVAQAGESLAQFSSRLWQTDEGLPDNNVEAIAQTPDGFLWVGTQDGLARFDGTHFDVFNPKNTPGLKSGLIRALCRTRDGSLWIGSTEGLSRLKTRTVEFHPLSQRPHSEYITSLHEAEDGGLWIGTLSGLFLLNGEKLREFTANDGLANGNIRSICECLGQVWIATAGGLNVFSNGCLIKPPLADADYFRHLRSVWSDREGNLWMGLRLGLLRLQGGKLTLFAKKDGMPDENVTVGYEDAHSNHWVGSMGSLCRFSDNAFTSELQAEGLAYGRIKSFFEDREGALWIGARDGLHQLRPKRFGVYSARNGLGHNNVMSVMEDKSGAMWCAMWGGGLARIKGDQLLNFSKEDRQPNALSTDSLLAVCEDHDGGILVGADYENGVFRFHDGVFERQSDPLPGLTDQSTRVIYRDREDVLWFGSNTGLVDWNHRAKYFSGEIVRVVKEDASGCLWVGTNKGLYRRQEGQFVEFDSQSAGLRHPVVSIFERAPGELWLGTDGGGLSRLKDGKLVTYGTPQGLFSDQIGEILEDNFGWLWMSCARGIFRARTEDFNGLDSHLVSAIRCTFYGKGDGLATAQCNDFAKPAAWKSRDGRLWFATTKGLVVIDPQSGLNLNDKPPPAVIEEFLADRKILYDSANYSGRVESEGRRKAGRILVTPGRGELEFRYAGLSFQVPEKVRFKYKLEGLDTDWTEAGSRRSAHYNNLAPGNYTFRVLACNNDGLWNESGAWLALAILPHFWETWWFRVVAGVSVLGMFFAAHQVRLSSERRLSRLRLRIARDLHDEVGSNLGSIALLSEVSARQSPGNPGEIPEIRRIATQTIESLRDIVWFLDPAGDDLSGVMLRMKDVARAMLPEIPFEFIVSGDISSKVPSLEFRRNIFPVYKEVLHNIVRHARAARVKIEARLNPGQFSLSVEDDGVGFDENAIRPGNGLKNLRRRCDELGGRCEIRSSPGHGTRVSIRMLIT